MEFEEFELFSRYSRIGFRHEIVFVVLHKTKQITDTKREQKNR